MCGRYSFAPKPKQIETELAPLALPGQLEIRYNIAPTQMAYVVYNEAPQALTPMQWGLVPHWSTDAKNAGKLINARAESLEEKPSFQEAARYRHCLVPADSFYEWRKEPGNQKVPYRIFLKNEQLLWMAGIWEEWQNHRTFSIITTTPNRDLHELHDRMPVILTNPADQQQWLHGGLEALPLLRPLPDGALDLYSVTTALNKVAAEGAALHNPEQRWTLF
jgi:putative SOS response-associated peptidase YedK